MSVSACTESDTAKAEQIWTAYQAQHNLSSSVGRTAGIDPRSGRVWIGESIPDVLAQRDADGIDALLFFERVAVDATACSSSRAKLPLVKQTDATSTTA